MPIKDTEARRISPTKLQKTKDTLTAITQLTDYAPARKDYGADKVAAINKSLTDTRVTEVAAENALAKARDAAAKAEWAAYNFTLTAAEQVMGQYGSSSDEYASLGYKKKSEYKKSTPGSKKAANG